MKSLRETTFEDESQFQARLAFSGCFYDAKLCERNELCYNGKCPSIPPAVTAMTFPWADSLFGTCVSDISDAINYNDLESEALEKAAKILQYLIETGYRWPDSYTQCVVGKYLQSVVAQEQYDPEVCEYLKALLDVIDQSRTYVETPAAAIGSGPVVPRSKLGFTD